MKILYTIPRAHIGGAERHLALLSKGMIDEGHDIMIFFLARRPENKDYIRAIESPVVFGKSEYIITGKKINLKQAFLTLLKLAWICSRFKPDVIQGYLPLANYYAVIVGNILRVPHVIISLRNTLWYSRNNWKLSIADRISCRLADVITVNCKKIKEDIIKKYHADPKKIRVLYNGR